MCSVLMALVVLFGNGIVHSSQLLSQDTQKVSDVLAANLRSVGFWPESTYQIVVPTETEIGKPDTQGRKSFRKRDTTLWDYNTAFIFHAFGETFHLNLTLDNAFISPNFVVQHVSDNYTWIEENPYKLLDCFYTGYLTGRPNSLAALSLCNGLHGSFTSSTEDYFIQPLYNDTRWNSEMKKPHIVYKRSSLKRNNHSHCGFQGSKFVNRKQNYTSNDSYVNLPWSYSSSRPRLRRSTSYPRNVEVLVVTDYKMYNYHGENLRQYVLTLMSIVALIYKDPSIGNYINIVIVKLISFQSDTEGPVISSSAADSLKSFCKWQYTINPSNDNDPKHHDTAVLITREDICRSPRKCDTLGLAELGTMCDAQRSCSITEDNGLSAAFTLAHELGHVFSMPHDDDVKCQLIKGKSKFKNEYHVMAPILDDNTHPWSWSECSRIMLTKYLDTGYGHCLSDNPVENYLEKVEQRMPGEIFNVDKQCELVFGKGSSVCPYMPACKRLWCTTNMGIQKGCRTQHMPWADGTKCSVDKWCLQGECSLRNPKKVKPIDGQWGPWDSFGDCSRPCGGGVKFSSRECNNPVPSHGGKYCLGTRIRYRSCETQDCPHGTKDFRDEQCSAYNGQHFNINGLPPDVQWVAMYSGINIKDRCKLFCRVSNSGIYYQMKDKVIDGTTCGSETSDICVNGVCRRAGCDRKLNSNQVLDACGICGGSNTSCRTISGTYNDVQYGYNHVVTIPSGATNLDVRQHGIGNSKYDDNYLVLKNSKNEYLLNGNFVVTTFKKEIRVGNFILEYTGSEAPVERINCSKTLPEDIIIQVLSVGKLNPPAINYTFVISVVHNYTYGKEWSKCSKICEGDQERSIICIENHSRIGVDEFYCKHSSKPSRVMRTCNTNCTLSWDIGEWSECTKQCNRYRKIHCKKEFKEYYEYINDSYCKELGTKGSTFEKCPSSCKETPHWYYGLWSQCSVSCGGGSWSRKAICVDAVNNSLPQSYCQDKPIILEKCNMGPCPKWATGDWTQCSVTCGKGYQARAIWCQQENLTISSVFCNYSQIPRSSRTCNPKMCEMWDLGDWEQCSTTCGNGSKRRIVRCRSADGSLLSDEDCSYESRPEDSEKCILPKCPATLNTLPTSSAITSFRIPGEFDSVKNYLTPQHFDLPHLTTASSFDLSTSQITANKLSSLNTIVTPPTSNSLRISSVAIPSYSRFKWKLHTWSQCSVTCGDGVVVRGVFICEDQFDRRHSDSACADVPKETHAVCKMTPCQAWKVGEWGQCSVTCNTGFQKRTVTCLMSDYSKCSIKNRPNTERTCEGPPCSNNDFMWITGEWGQCNVTCGDGFQQRIVVCQNLLGEQQSDHKCKHQYRPDVVKGCNLGLCSNAASWSTAPWGSCSTSCGKGTKFRDVFCYSSDGKLLQDSNCLKSKPRSYKSCHPKCPLWHKSAWNDCSATCGEGYRKRKVTCRKGREYLSDYSCLHQERPHESEACMIRRCGGVGWKFFDWFSCSVTCGSGFKERKVFCVDSSNQPIDDSQCIAYEKPQFRKSCRTSPCHYQWITSLWSECSTTCGGGEQKREVNCVTLDNSQVSEKHCNPDLKPKSKRSCNTRLCYAMSCRELQSFFGQYADGEYQLLFKDRFLQVYCKDMNTSHPMEFITLQSGESENYSEIYSKRLMNPESCPNNGNRLEDCKCIEDQNPRAGLTTFSKIRINITSLQVNTIGFSYAESVHGELVPFANAGDCYSSANCPQGQFMINLSNTGLIVSSRTVWNSHGNKHSQRIDWSENGRIIKGYCGGYCGQCSPDPRTGLQLELAPP